MHPDTIAAVTVHLDHWNPYCKDVALAAALPFRSAFEISSNSGKSPGPQLDQGGFGNFGMLTLYAQATASALHGALQGSNAFFLDAFFCLLHVPCHALQKHFTVAFAVKMAGTPKGIGQLRRNILKRENCGVVHPLT